MKLKELDKASENLKEARKELLKAEQRAALKIMCDCPYHRSEAAGDESWDYCTVKLRDFQITEALCLNCDTWYNERGR